MKSNKINEIFYENYKKKYVYEKNTQNINWWHQIELPNSEITPGCDACQSQWEHMMSDLPSFKGKTVLDIGAWDGYFSFKAESLEIDVPDINPDTVGAFDIVMMFGVLYHLPSFFTSFVNIASCAKSHFLIETLIDLEVQQNVPLFRFFPFDECHNDHTNWFAPNPKAVMSMMEYCGFKEIKQKTYTDTGVMWPRATFFGQKINHKLISIKNM